MIERLFDQKEGCELPNNRFVWKCCSLQIFLRMNSWSMTGWEQWCFKGLTDLVFRTLWNKIEKNNMDSFNIIWSTKDWDTWKCSNGVRFSSLRWHFCKSIHPLSPNSLYRLMPYRESIFKIFLPYKKPVMQWTNYFETRLVSPSNL